MSDGRTGLYKSCTLSKPSREIRLLRIVHSPEQKELCCTLSAYQRDVAPPYRAISYTWGDVLNDKRTLRIDGKRVEAGENFYYALWQASRYARDAVLRVDFLCINQDDARERTSQVAIMADIYAEATEVLSCLGPHDDSSWFVFGLAAELTQLPCFNAQEGWTSLHDQSMTLKGWAEVNRCHIAFARRSYWRRLWVVQEVSMGVPDRLRFLCGDSHLTYHELENFSTAHKILGSTQASIKDEHLVCQSNLEQVGFTAVTNLLQLAIEPPMSLQHLSQ